MEGFQSLPWLLKSFTFVGSNPLAHFSFETKVLQMLDLKMGELIYIFFSFYLASRLLWFFCLNKVFDSPEILYSQLLQAIYNKYSKHVMFIILWNTCWVRWPFRRLVSNLSHTTYTLTCTEKVKIILMLHKEKIWHCMLKILFKLFLNTCRFIAKLQK